MEAAPRPARLTCPRAGPAPPEELPSSHPGVGCPGPRSLPELPGCPSHRLSGGEGRGCVGPRGAEGPRSLRGLRSAPFTPQRVVAATRAPRLFYKRLRALPRRAGASAGGSAPALREGQGSAPAEQRGRCSRRLAARPPGGKGRAIPEGAEATMRGKR
nr:putative cuticle collagen 99 [Pan troglodytes]